MHHLSNGTFHLFTYEEDSVLYMPRETAGVYNYDTIFDFKASPGDKWRMYNTQYPQCRDSRVTVVDTGSRIIQGQRLKWLFLHYLSGTVNAYDTAYVRLGALTLFPYMWDNVCETATDSHWGGALRCFSDNQISEYRNQYTLPCDYGEVASMPEQTASPSRLLFSNPFSSMLHITSNFEFSAFIITDLRGSVIYSVDHPSNTLVWDCENYPSGLYIGFCRWPNGEQQTIKLLKK